MTGSSPGLDPVSIRFMLEECKTWAVVGLSGRPDRTAYSIASLLQSQSVAIGARGVWSQLGVVDHAAFRPTAEAGVPLVMDTCPPWSGPA